MIVHQQVLAIVWMDNAPVTMLSTVHNISHDDDFVERIQRCPRGTSANAKNVRAVFHGNNTATLKIPKLIDDSNYNTNGVDVCDQLRSYYSTN
ncbi:hypothetical protein KI688_010522 [Linnemannia hyalina]|uniref:PiggyBac transposable element-derived protein domain-containing protein n=1 Tax=Linnemannia hyalina TaxID=64524 RepID=A0A9P7XZQ5_9FUNG|nr:hypothetical protein KI688_010522 [Linnemannia hyalina]